MSTGHDYPPIRDASKIRKGDRIRAESRDDRSVLNLEYVAQTNGHVHAFAGRHSELFWIERAPEPPVEVPKRALDGLEAAALARDWGHHPSVSLVEEQALELLRSAGREVL